jgi:hypothetical protein
VVGKDDTAEIRKIEVALSGNGYAVVASGITAGDYVVMADQYWDVTTGRR